MSVTTQVGRPEHDGLSTRGSPGRSHAGLLLPSLILVQGMAFVLLIGLAGSPLWRGLRMLAVVGITAAAAMYSRRPGVLGRGATALVLGIAGTVAGAGIGGVYLAKVGVSVLAPAGLICLGTGLWLLGWGAVTLTRALPSWWRLLVVPVALLILAFVLYPLTTAVNATNRPRTSLGAVTPGTHGLSYQDVSFSARDGVRLSGWYVPSANGAAVVLLPGSGSTRVAVLGQAVVLARHGYGVLMLDTRGHGGSDGHAMDFGWWGNRDIAAAVSYLGNRPDVRSGRIAAVGMSMGGEQAVAAAGSDPRILAVVGEGVTGMQAADHGWLSNYGVRGQITRAIDWVTYQAAGILSRAPRPTALRDAVRSAAPRPILLIAGGDVPDEAMAGRFFRAASPQTVQLWIVPGAGHTRGLAAHPADWESHVIGFLDAVLLGQ